jgi:hypothetical protein
MFLSLVQADGYNPLTVATTNFKVPSQHITALVQDLGIEDPVDIASLQKILAKSFRIGSLFSDMKSAGITIFTAKEEFMKKVVTVAKQVFAGQFAQNGFWADVSTQ